MRKSKKKAGVSKSAKKRSISMKNKIDRGYIGSVDLKNRDFTQSIIEGNKNIKKPFNNIDFTSSIFKKAKFIHVSAKSAIFKNADFTNALIEKSIFDDANFESSILNYARFNSSILNGAKFKDATADSVIFNDADLTNVVISSSNFNGANFNDGILEKFSSNISNFSNSCFDKCYISNGMFLECEFTDSKFIKTNLKSTIFTNCFSRFSDEKDQDIFIDCNLDDVKLYNSSCLLFTAIKSRKKVNKKKNIYDTTQIINNLTIEILNDINDENNIISRTFTHSNFTFNELHISNILIRNENDNEENSPSQFNNCIFNKLKLSNKVQFFGIMFNNSTFKDCNFGNFIGSYTSYYNCIFNNCDISECILQRCFFINCSFTECKMQDINFAESDFENTSFNDCKMNNANLIRCMLINITFNENTILTNVNFQESQGMNNMNFQKINMEGARLSGVVLRGSDFQNAKLQGVQFDYAEVHGCNFTNANLKGSNILEAYGSDEAIGIPKDHIDTVKDIHNAFDNININRLLDFYIIKGNFEKQTPKTNRSIIDYALLSLKLMLSKLDPNEYDIDKLNIDLKACFTERLNSFNFKNVINNKDKIEYGTFIYGAIRYVQIQPPEFQNLYIVALIKDSTETYGPNGMSCAHGIIERFITSMEHAAVPLKDKFPDKAKEYEELINIIIIRNPKSLIKAYQQEWFEIHKENGSNAFAKSNTLDDKMKSYEVFLKQKFDYANLRGSNKENIRKLIMNDPNAGVNITKQLIDKGLLMFGGRQFKNNNFNKFKTRNTPKNSRLVKNLIAGAFSPISASKKIQSVSRGRLLRKSKKSQELSSLLSKGASVYKKALQTLDFRGINMEKQILSRRVLDGAKFQKVNFTLSKLNGAKMNNVLADGANFEFAELKKTIANNSSFNGAIFFNANLEGFKAHKSKFNNCKFNAFPYNSCKLIRSKFAVCEMKNCLFERVEYIGAEFDKTDLTGSTFSKQITYANPTFIDCNLDNVTFDNAESLLSSINSSISSSENRNEINNLKIISSTQKKQIIEDNFTFNKFTFNNLHISNILIRDGGKFNNCTFTNLKLDKIGEEVVQFFKLHFDKCTFIDCNFGELLGHTSNYTECIFQNSNLSKCDLRLCIFRESTFINCNMNAVKFARSNLTGVNFIDGTILTNVDFQECEGMDGMSFRGLNLQGARMIGISDPGLNACNFRDANLRGVQFDFSQIHGSDFTGADLTGSNVRLAEGSDQTVGIPEDQEEGRTVDTHKTFYKIRTNMLLDFYIEKADIEFPYTAPSDNDLRELALTTLRRMVDNLDESETIKRELISSLEACFTQQLNTYNFGQVIAGTDPHVNFRKLIYCVIKYLEKQPKEFKDIYVQSLIMDSAHAYGRGGMSCAAGIVERFVTVMEQAAAVVKDTVTSKTEEYEELMNIIRNDPKSLIKAYQQEWFEIHKENGSNAFAESDTLDDKMKSYEVFLEQKFDYANLRGSNKENIRKLIMNDPNAGVNITRNYIENSILFFGGRIKDNRHLNKFKTRNTRKK